MAASSASEFAGLTPDEQRERDARDTRVRELMHQLVRAVERGFHPFEVRRIASSMGRELRLQVQVTHRRLIVNNGHQDIEDVPIGKHMTTEQIDALARALVLSAEN